MVHDRDFRKLSAVAQAELRGLAVDMVRCGKSRIAVAEIIGVNRRFIGEWVRRFAVGGNKALESRPRGRPSRTREAGKNTLSNAAIAKRPVTAGSAAPSDRETDTYLHGDIHRPAGQMRQGVQTRQPAAVHAGGKSQTPALARAGFVQATMMQEVADAAGVHRSTASRALNPSTSHMLSSDVAARIVDIAAKLGYRRNLLAASMRNNRTRLVGILVPDLANPLFAPILAGAEAALADHGYAVLVANTRVGETTKILGTIDDLVGRRAEGLILATARADDPVLAHCAALGLPTVLVNRADFAGRFAAATPDDREGMRIAVRHLIGLGHRHIGHVAGPQDVSTGRARRDGFIEEMGAAGLLPGPIVTAASYTRDAGRTATDLLLQGQQRLTAIAAANDLLALGAYQALGAAGLSCPQDISVTGHNDMALVDMVQPGLTTVRIRHDQIGREAARLLLERISNPGAPLTQIKTSPELVLRASTARPASR